jgi:hypothetical protein
MRTQEQIKRQVDGLKEEKKSLPEMSELGTNNWECIDAQLDILEGIKDLSDFEDASDDTYMAANDAANWVEEEEDNDLF